MIFDDDSGNPILRVEELKIADSSMEVTFRFQDGAGYSVSFVEAVTDPDPLRSVDHIIRQAHEQLRDRLGRVVTEANRFVRNQTP